MPLDSAPDDERRFDGLTNVITGLGDDARDRSMWTGFQPTTLPLPTIEALYRCHGIAARFIDRPADDMTREGFTIRSDGIDDAALASYMEEIGRDAEGRPTDVLRTLADFHRWGDMYGGSILVAACDDGMPPSEPLDLNRIQSLRGFFVLDREDVSPLSLTGGPPEAYLINDISRRIPLEDRMIHASRVLKYTGYNLPARVLRDGAWWGSSMYNRVWTQLRHYMTAHSYSERILHNFIVRVFKILGLADAHGAKDEDALRNRLRALDMGADIMHGLFLDAGDGGKRPPEDYVPVSVNVTGVPDLMDRFIAALVAAGPQPRSVLLGETPGGLNAGENAGEIRSWYDWVKVRQIHLAVPWLNWMLAIMFSAKDGPTNGKLPAEWTTEPKPLWQPTETELADARLKRAQGDQIYSTIIGSIGPDEVREARHGEDVGPEEVPATAEALPMPPDMPPEPLDEPAAPKPTETEQPENVQAEALNGAQIAGFIELVKAVQAGEMPRDTAIRFLPVAFPGAIPSVDVAATLLAATEEGASPKPQPPAPFGQPPQPPPQPGKAPEEPDEDPEDEQE